MEHQLNNFTKIHDEFIADWNEALNSGDTSSLERMTEDYYVVFFKAVNKKPIIFNRQEALAGMQQSVMQFLGANKKFENRIIRLKDEKSAVVFYEQLIERNAKVLARFFTIENWQLTNGKWMIVRETEEPIN
ncbi:nuclear transport factor 2 family protein [Virgibacillus necropolis]|uniref:nuclear transport factor 2 family protein n=1 Tax=Virgibacillus necropolis TaxID=163877 RepID=UPI00384FE023